jgi:hypothetical protein
MHGNNQTQFIIANGDNLNINQLQTYEVTNNQFDLNQILSGNNLDANGRMINIDNPSDLNMLLNEGNGFENEADTEELLKNIEQMLTSIDSESMNSTIPNVGDNDRAVKVNAVQNLQHRILNNNRIIIINNNGGMRNLIKQEPIDNILSSNKTALNTANNTPGFKKISPKTNQPILPKDGSVVKAPKPLQPQLQTLTVPTPENLKAGLKNNTLVVSNNVAAKPQPIAVKPKEPVQQNQTLTVLTAIPAATVPIIIASASPATAPTPVAPVALIKPAVTPDKTENDLPSAKRIKQEMSPKKTPAPKQEVSKTTTPSTISSPAQGAEKPKPPVAFNIPNNQNIDVIFIIVYKV